MSTACSYCQVTLVGLENGKRFKTIMDSTPIFYALDVRFLPKPAAYLTSRLEAPSATSAIATVGTRSSRTNFVPAITRKSSNR